MIPIPRTRALAELERALGERFFLCTQNVDSLHEQAGSQRVIHMHGRLMQTRCSREALPHAAFRRRAAVSEPRGNSHLPEVRRDAAPTHLLVRRSALRDGPHLRTAQNAATCC